MHFNGGVVNLNYSIWRLYSIILVEQKIQILDSEDDDVAELLDLHSVDALPRNRWQLTAQCDSMLCGAFSTGPSEWLLRSSNIRRARPGAVKWNSSALISLTMSVSKFSSLIPMSIPPG